MIYISLYIIYHIYQGGRTYIIYGHIWLWVNTATSINPSYFDVTRPGYSAARPASCSKRLPWARPARRSRKRCILNVSRRGSGPGSFCGMQITRYWPQETWESKESLLLLFFSGVVYLFLKSGECAASRLSLAATRTLTAAPSKWGPTSTDPARPKTLRRPALEVRMGPRGNQGIYFNTSILYCRYIIYILIHLYYIVDIL